MYKTATSSVNDIGPSIDAICVYPVPEYTLPFLIDAICVYPVPWYNLPSFKDAICLYPVPS